MKKEKYGDCFDVAGRMIMDAEGNDMKLVHGEVYSRHFKRRIWHAWIEMGGGDVVLDHSNGGRVVMRSERYYKIAKLKEKHVKRYTRDEACKLMLDIGHFGPWDEKEVKE